MITKSNISLKKSFKLLSFLKLDCCFPVHPVKILPKAGELKLVSSNGEVTKLVVDPTKPPPTQATTSVPPPQIEGAYPPPYPPYPPASAPPHYPPTFPTNFQTVRPPYYPNQ